MSSTLDDHIRAALDRIRVSLSGQIEADLSASTSDILRAVADEHRRALVEATERTEATMRSEAEQQLALVREEFAREREEFAREREELARQREELQRSSTSEIAGLERTLDERRDELSLTRRDLEDLQGAHAALQRQIDEHLQDLDRGRQELEEHRLQLDESNQGLERHRQDLEQARLESESAQREAAGLRTRLAQTARLASALRTLDEAKSLGDILEQLVQSACQETERTAVFLVNGEKLRGWRALGFPAGQPIVGSDFDPAESGVVGQVMRSGAGQQHRNGDAAHLPSFAQADGPRDAAALPVQVGGSVIAVLYADAARADRPEDPQWLDAIDTMTKHAGRVLEAMTVRQAAALWTPRGGVVRS